MEGDTGASGLLRQALLNVEWLTQHVDSRLHRYGLVSVRPVLHVCAANEYLRIERLVPADRVCPSFDLFKTIPPDWLADRELVARASREDAGEGATEKPFAKE